MQNFQISIWMPPVVFLLHMLLLWVFSCPEFPFSASHSQPARNKGYISRTGKQLEVKYWLNPHGLQSLQIGSTWRILWEKNKTAAMSSYLRCKASKERGRLIFLTPTKIKLGIETPKYAVHLILNLTQLTQIRANKQPAHSSLLLGKI